MRLIKPTCAAAAIVAALVLGCTWLDATNEPLAIETRLAVARQARETAEALLRSQRANEAEQVCRQGLATLDGLTAGSSSQLKCRRERAAVLDTLGLILVERHLTGEAIAYFNEANNLRARLVAAEPAATVDREPLASGLYRLGVLYHDTGRSHEALATLTRGLRFCEAESARATADSRLAHKRIMFLERLGLLYADMDRRSESIAWFTKAIGAQRNQVRIRPAGAPDRECLANLLLRLATIFETDGQPAAAENALAQALDVAEALHDDFPANDHQSGLIATVLDRLAALIKSNPGRRPEARDLLGRVVAIRENLVADLPDSPDELANLAASYDSLAGLCRDWQSFDEAEAIYRKELACRARLAVGHPGVDRYRLGHGRALHHLADLLRERGRPAEALVLEQRSAEQP